MYIISVITTSHFTPEPTFSHTPERQGSQCRQHFGKGKSIFAVEGVDADCRLPTGHFQLFYLVIIFTAGQYN